MNDIYALLKLYGNRYIFCDDEQAELDVQINREDMAAAYVAILHFAELKEETNAIENGLNDIDNGSIMQL